jgi:hypothetical protein
MPLGHLDQISTSFTTTWTSGWFADGVALDREG